MKQPACCSCSWYCKEKGALWVCGSKDLIKGALEQALDATEGPATTLTGQKSCQMGSRPVILSERLVLTLRVTPRTCMDSFFWRATFVISYELRGLQTTGIYLWPKAMFDGEEQSGCAASTPTWVCHPHQAIHCLGCLFWSAFSRRHPAMWDLHQYRQT